MSDVTVDVSFPWQLAVAPRDHGYALYAAISRVVPALHGARWLGIHPLSGKLMDGALNLGRRASLWLRIPIDRIQDALPLAGKTLTLGDRHGALGALTVHPLVPAASLDARMVAIKLTEPPRSAGALSEAAFRERYEREIARQLAELDIRKPFAVRGKRRLTVDGKRILGYSVRVAGLAAEESLRLSAEGIGGKRRMGCGIFRPTRGR